MLVPPYTDQSYAKIIKPHDETAKPSIDKNINQNVVNEFERRDLLLKYSRESQILSNEVKALIEIIGKVVPSSLSNDIIDNLERGHYSRKTLPIPTLLLDLKDAGLVQIANEIGKMRFTDPGLNPPRGIREKDFRIHENLTDYTYTQR